MDAQLVVASDRFVVAQIYETEGQGRLTVNNGTAASEPEEIAVGALLSGGLHPVASPAGWTAKVTSTRRSADRGAKRRQWRFTKSTPRAC